MSAENPIAPDVLDVCVDVTEPSESEIERTVAFRPTRRRRWPVAVAILAAVAVLLVAFLGWPTSSQEVVSPVVGFGPSIEVSGPGEVVALNVDVDGAEVEVVAGLSRFEVDPHGVGSNLRVRAGDVTVVVTGTIFTVEVSDPGVTVAVIRGSVEIHTDGRVLPIGAGETWRSIEQEVEEPPVPLLPRPVLEPAAIPEVAPVAALAVPAAEVYVSLLERVERGDRTVAPELLAFVAEYPDSPLASEARVAHVEFVAVDDPAAAVVAIDDWLSDEPETPRRISLIRMRATLARDRLKDCGLALPSYRVLDDELSDPEAAAWRGICAAALDLGEEARDALERADRGNLQEPLRLRVRELRN